LRRPASRPFRLSTTGHSRLETAEAADLLGVLAQPTRLEAFRLLNRFFPHGLSAGDVARLLAVPHNTLSSHLAALDQAGLVASRREGRRVIYVANPAPALALLGFLAASVPGASMPVRLPDHPALPARKDIAMPQRPFAILVLCTGNSARSILAEAILNREGKGRILAYSAGSQPKGEPNPYALELLEELGYDIAGFRSKSWDEFSGATAPRLDLVITVCDSAAGESCPVFIGAPIKAHWGLEDPASVTISAEAARAAFRRTYRELTQRVTRLVNLPFETMDPAALQAELAEIAKMDGATAMALGAVA
jgi:protein-tyrosine-phosphatase/DNA-binding transcriptional ArsR family regulator